MALEVGCPVTAEIGEATTSHPIEKEIDMRRIVFAIIIIGLGFSGVASAQDAPPPPCGPAGHGYVAYCVQKLLSRKSGHGTRLLVEVDLLTKE